MTVTVTILQEKIMSATLRTKRTLLPGKPGTKRWVEQYGEKLVCVRYRYDPERHIKVTTVELVAEHRIWEKNPRKIPGHKRVAIREVELGKQVKAAGGRWNREKKVWEVAYQQVIALGLTERMIVATGDDV